MAFLAGAALASEGRPSPPENSRRLRRKQFLAGAALASEGRPSPPENSRRLRQYFCPLEA
jgi:hypothetical protein